MIQDGESPDGTVELLRELDDLVDWGSEPDDGPVGRAEPRDPACTRDGGWRG